MRAEGYEVLIVSSGSIACGRSLLGNVEDDLSSLDSRQLFSAVGQAKLASLVSVVMALAAPLVTLVALWPLGLEGLWLNTPVASVLTAGVCGFVLLRFKGSVHERAAAAREGS